MAIKFGLPTSDSEHWRPQITVFGVGGAGGNAVNNMIRGGPGGVNYIVANTDAQDLSKSECERRVRLGSNLTKGLGTGSDPKMGREAAEESIDEISNALDGTNMLFIAAGMGGGTGTGAAPIIAQRAHQLDILTVAVVTKPFEFESSRRRHAAEFGIEELSRSVDSLIVVPNQKLLQTADIGIPLNDAFRMVDDVLCSNVRSIANAVSLPGLINVDFADARAVLHGIGKAVIGSGEAKGKERAITAAQAAITNPLLEDGSIKGAIRALINICGGHDLTLVEVDEAAARVRSELSSDALIIVGSTLDEALDGRLRVSVIAKHAHPSADGEAKPALRNTSSSNVRESCPPSWPWCSEANSQIDAKLSRAITASDLVDSKECVDSVSPTCSNPSSPSDHVAEELSTSDYLDQIPEFLRRREDRNQESDSV